MSYFPINAKALKIGLSIKLEHSWTEHPFIRNVFKIKSAKEIAIIQRNGLDKIFYDPKQSDPKALEALKNPPSSEAQESSEDEKVLDQEVSKAEEALRKEKDARIKVLKARQDNLEKTEKIYGDVLKQGRFMIKDVSEGHEKGLKVADKIIEDIIETLEGDTASTSVISKIDQADLSENISFMHALNVCILSMTIGKEFDLNREEMHMLGLGALFHDVGKQKIPAIVRYKKRKLTRAEINLMNLHCQYGKELVEGTADFPEPSREIIIQHHERIDGSGFPDGLTADDISFLSKIVMVVNQYDDMTNNLDTNKNITPAQALGHIYKKMQEKFANEVIVALIQSLTVYPPGTLVKLNDGSIGMVISINHQDRMLPVVMVHDPEASKENAIILDMAQDKDFKIEFSILPNKVSREVLRGLNPSNMNNYFLSKNDMP